MLTFCLRICAVMAWRAQNKIKQDKNVHLAVEKHVVNILINAILLFGYGCTDHKTELPVAPSLKRWLCRYSPPGGQS